MKHKGTFHMMALPPQVERESHDATCDKCGHVFTIGDWAWCPHEPVCRLAVHDDQIEGGPRPIDFGGDEIFVSSKSEWRRELAARPNLVHVDRHDASYYARQRKQHDERLRDTKQIQA